MKETIKFTSALLIFCAVLFIALSPKEQKIKEETYTVRCEVYKIEDDLIFARDGLEVYSFQGKEYNIGDIVMCTVASYEEGTYDDYVKEVNTMY